MDRKNEIAEKISGELSALEREFSSSPFISAVFGAFVLYIAHNCPERTELKDILLANHISNALSEVITEEIGGHWDRYRPMLTAYSQSDLADFFALKVSGEQLGGAKRLDVASSQPIVGLVIRLLDLREGDSVCDLGCAVGDFLSLVHDEKKLMNLQGVEISQEIAALAELRLMCRGVKAKVTTGSVFDRVLNSLKCDRVFCDAPLAVRGLPQDEDVRRFIEREFPDFPELNAGMQGDWIFAARAVAAMKKEGRAAVVLSPSVMSDARNAPYRRYFIQRHLIEAVVELPARLFAHTNLPTYLVVFGAGRDKVKMVRADDLCYSNRKNNVIGKGHIDIIAACLGLSATSGREGLDEYCVEISDEELLKDGCDLSVKSRFADPEEVKNGVELGVLVSAARRGATIASGELDAEMSEEVTSCRYLAPGDINDGVMADDLLCLKEVPAKYLPYVARPLDLVITRVMASGAEFKTAVVEIEEGVSVLPNGNLLVLTVDPEKADPYFIKACIDSPYAQRYLADCSVGSAVRTLSYKNLERLPIPAVPLARQRAIGKVCRESAQKISRLRRDYLAEKKRLGEVLIREAGDCLNTAED